MNAINEAFTWAMTDEEHRQTLAAEASLSSYIPIVWPVLEPGRKFVSGFAVDAICEALQAVSDGYIQKLLINVPPGCMKSLTTCVLWPSWEWGPRNRADLRYVCASYSDALTIRDNRKTRLVIQSDEYQVRWGHRFKLVSDQNAKTKFETDRRGFKIATSVGGLGTGERGDRLVIDDPHNVKDGESEAVRESTLAWFTETMSTRVNDPGRSSFVVIMQRVHERDVSGLILAKEMGYTHLMLPMDYERDRKCIIQIKHPRPEELEIDLEEPELSDPLEYHFEDPRSEEGELLWAERFTRDYVENDLKPALRAWGGGYAEAGQLQQSPIPRGGGMFQRGDFQFIEASEVATLNGRACRGWDLAASDGQTSAYTAGVKGMIDQHGRLIILDVVRDRQLANGVKKMLATCGNQDGKHVEIDIPQDPGQAGKAQRADLAKHLHGYIVRFSLESGEKTVRATPVSSQAEAGNMYLVRGPWNDAFINELVVFPNGQFADQTDATSRMYANLLRKSEVKRTFAPTIVEVA